jgi:hypothetical protein
MRLYARAPVRTALCALRSTKGLCSLPSYPCAAVRITALLLVRTLVLPLLGMIKRAHYSS